ncbi:MAG: hypothetical protein ACLGI6_17885, partial [Gammaproteobacteria bacterium]
MMTSTPHRRIFPRMNGIATPRLAPSSASSFAPRRSRLERIVQTTFLLALFCVPFATALTNLFV